jgi:cysteinyl-tRNA synthetase
MLKALGFAEPRSGSDVPAELSAQIVGLIRARADARAARDWKRADELRAELARLDVTVKDTPQGTDWEWKGLRATERL